MNSQLKQQITARQQQRGAVLVVALVLLTVLTFIAITALNTSSLEEKMASNTQEVNQAFQVADSGVTKAFLDPNSFSLSAVVTDSVSAFGSNDAEAAIASEFKQWTAPPRGSGYSATSFQAAHFETVSQGGTPGGAQTTVTAGAYQIAPSAS